MKKIYRPTFKELLGIKSSFFKDLFNSEGQQEIYNPFTLLFLTIIISTILGFFESRGFVLSLSLSCYLFIQYKKTTRLATGLEVKREFPKRVIEGEEVLVRYEISNYSNYAVSEFNLIDSFEGTRESLNKLFISKKINSGSRQNFISQVPINEGMGTKKFNQLELILSDELGLFNYSLVEESTEEMEVFPKIEKLPPYELPVARFSQHFGEQDVASRGDSVNFLGTRAYVYGDPVKRINWRQSVKTGEVIVNYFEKNINKTFTILMNIDQRLHSGIGHFSSHEYLRDMALSLMSQNISNGNEITLITNKKNYPKGSGQRFVNQMELEMFKLDLILDDHAEDFVLRSSALHHGFSGDGSSLVYLTPIVTGALFEKNMEALRTLKRRGFEVKVIWVNAFNYLSEKIQFGSEESIKYRQSLVSKLEIKWRKIFKKDKISCLAINISEKEFRNEVEQAMELS